MNEFFLDSPIGQRNCGKNCFLGFLFLGKTNANLELAFNKLIDNCLSVRCPEGSFCSFSYRHDRKFVTSLLS